MQPQRRAYLTEEEYLAIERQAEYKSEYYRGKVYPMAGGSKRSALDVTAEAGASETHNLITVNIAVELHGMMKNRPCKVYSSDMRVRIQATGSDTYPDVVVVCGKAIFDNTIKDTLINPMVIIEVLSESTEAYDRGKKFEKYRLIPELREYGLVAQDRPYVEVFTRSDATAQWVLSEATGADAAIELLSIECTLPLADIYSKVEFDEQLEPA